MKIGALLLTACLTSIRFAFAMELFGEHPNAHAALAHMTPREMVAQLFMATAISNPENKGYFNKPWKGDPEYVAHLITQHKIGGIIMMGFEGCTKQHRTQLNHYQQLSNSSLLVGIDGEWLTQRIHDVPPMPTAMTMGAVADESILHRMGQERAAFCKALGAHIDFGPVLDVNTNPLNPIIGMRSFGDNPAEVARKAIRFMEGIHEGGVIACGKHFPGHGDTIHDSHLQLPVIMHDKERLEHIELYPFQEAIKQGIKALMPGHLTVPALEDQPGLPATLSRAILIDLLRKKMGFKGLIITDALPMKALDAFAPGELELQSLLAGNDILLCSADTPLAIEHIMQAIDRQEISLDLIKEKALRVLLAKEWVRAHNGTFFVKEQDLLRLHTPASYALKQELFKNAITLLDHSEQPYTPLDGAQPVGLIEIGMRSESIFKNLLAQKSNFTHAESGWWLSTEHQAHLETLFNDHERIIIVFNNYTQLQKAAHNSAQNAFTSLLDTWKSQGKQLTCVVFDSPYNLQSLTTYGSVLLAFESSACTQVATVDILCGKEQAIGVLPLRLS